MQEDLPGMPKDMPTGQVAAGAPSPAGDLVYGGTLTRRPPHLKPDPVSTRWSTAIFAGVLAAMLCGLWATPSSIAAKGRAQTRITSSGRIGALRLDRSDRAAIVAAAGEPQVDEFDAGMPPGSGWEALGYGCGAKDMISPLVAPTAAGGPNCRTVYYLNSETGRLGTFFTSMRSFRDGHGVVVGTPTARAVRREGAQAYAGCGDGILVKTPRAMYHLVISGGHMHRRGNRLLVRGGRIGALVLHSRESDVGVFDCW